MAYVNVHDLLLTPTAIPNHRNEAKLTKELRILARDMFYKILHNNNLIVSILYSATMIGP